MHGKLISVTQERQTVAGFDHKASDFEKIQWAISELEKRVSVNKVCDIRKPVNVGLQNRLVKLIGSKPLINCKINDMDSEVLLDTGSQVSMCDMAWLAKHAPGVEIQPVTDFLEQGEEVKFLAANNTEVRITGAVVLNFALGQCCFPVPFVVTDGPMSQPLLGFNVMEHIVTMGKSDTIVSSLHHAMNISVGTVNVMMKLISQNFEDTDCLGILRCTKNVIIPAKSTMRIKCRVKGDVRGADMSFVCSAPVSGEWDEDLEVTQSLGEVVRGRTPNVNVEISNNAAKPKKLPANMVVGEISAVSAVIPINISETSPVKVASVTVPEGEVTSPERVSPAEDSRAAVQHAHGVTNADLSGDPQAQEALPDTYHVPLNDIVDTDGESVQSEFSELDIPNDIVDVDSESVHSESSEVDILNDIVGVEGDNVEEEVDSDQSETFESGNLVENDSIIDVEPTSDDQDEMTEIVDTVPDNDSVVGSIGDAEETLLEDSSTSSSTVYESGLEYASTVYDSATDDGSWVNSESESERSSFNSASSSPAPSRPTRLRRGTRNAVPPPVFTYDKIGTPVIKYQTRSHTKP